MNRIFNRFLINFPNNTVFGWGAKIDKIDTMKVLGISSHKRKYMIFNKNHPYVLKIKYLDIEKNHMQYYNVNGNPSVFITPFTSPDIIVIDDSHLYDINYVVISRRFQDKDTCVNFMNNMKIRIDGIDKNIQAALLDSDIKK